MNREQVWEGVSGYLKREFGRLLEVRDVRRVRRVAGDGWLVTVVMAAPSREVHVVDLSVDEDGKMTPLLDGDHLIRAIERVLKQQTAAVADDLGGLDEFGPSESDDGDLLMGDDDPFNTYDSIKVKVDDFIATWKRTADQGALMQARDMLPRMLASPDRRAPALLRMAEIEKMLGEHSLAMGYLEAAAREFGDRFDLQNLEKVAVLALQILGKEKYSESTVHALLEQAHARLAPMDELFSCRSLDLMRPEHRERVMPLVELRTLEPEEILVSEGSPSVNVYVVRSGLIAVLLENPEGGSRTVRCCFPGWLLGESSVLAPGNPICSATLRAERLSEVWVIPAPILREVMNEDPDLGSRIAETKQLHRIDSFFSMHETMGQLDVQVRDEMLGCIQRLVTFEEDGILFNAGDTLLAGYLIARGEITLHSGAGANGPVLQTVGADSFLGVRDAMHQIPAGVTAVAHAGSVVAYFDADRLRGLGQKSPDHVVAVLERLG